VELRACAAADARGGEDDAVGAEDRRVEWRAVVYRDGGRSSFLAGKRRSVDVRAHCVCNSDLFVVRLVWLSHSPFPNGGPHQREGRVLSCRERR